MTRLPESSPFGGFAESLAITERERTHLCDSRVLSLAIIRELARGLIRYGGFVAMVPLFFNYVIRPSS